MKSVLGKEVNYRDYEFPGCFQANGCMPANSAKAEGKTISTKYGDRYVIDLTITRGGASDYLRLFPRNKPGKGQTFTDGAVKAFTFRVGQMKMVDPKTGEVITRTGAKHLVGDGEAYSFQENTSGK